MEISEGLNANATLKKRAEQFCDDTEPLVIDVKPRKIVFGITALNVTQKKKIRLSNVSTIGQRAQIVLPASQYFAIDHRSQGLLNVGMGEDLMVYFTPTEFRPYYDWLYVYCQRQGENEVREKGGRTIKIQLEAQPEIGELALPSHLTLPPCAVGETVTKVIPLKTSAPVDANYRIEVLQEHDDFLVNPSRGVVPVNAETFVTVSYTPSSYATALFKFAIRFDGVLQRKPCVLSVSSRALPGLARDRVVAHEVLSEQLKPTHTFVGSSQPKALASTARTAAPSTTQTRTLAEMMGNLRTDLQTVKTTPVGGTVRDDPYTRTLHQKAQKRWKKQRELGKAGSPTLTKAQGPEHPLTSTAAATQRKSYVQLNRESRQERETLKQLRDMDPMKSQHSVAQFLAKAKRPGQGTGENLHRKETKDELEAKAEAVERIAQSSLGEGQVFISEECEPSLQLAAFLKRLKGFVSAENMKARRFCVCTGLSAPTPQQIEAVRESRAHRREDEEHSAVAQWRRTAAHTHTASAARPPKASLNTQEPLTLPSQQPSYDPLLNTAVGARHRFLLRFQDAARTVLVRLRAQNRLQKIKAYLSTSTTTNTPSTHLSCPTDSSTPHNTALLTPSPLLQLKPLAHSLEAQTLTSFQTYFAAKQSLATAGAFVQTTGAGDEATTAAGKGKKPEADAPLKVTRSTEKFSSHSSLPSKNLERSGAPTASTKAERKSVPSAVQTEEETDFRQELEMLERFDLNSLRLVAPLPLKVPLYYRQVGYAPFDAPAVYYRPVPCHTAPLVGAEDELIGLEFAPQRRRGADSRREEEEEEEEEGEEEGEGEGKEELLMKKVGKVTLEDEETMVYTSGALKIRAELREKEKKLRQKQQRMEKTTKRKEEKTAATQPKQPSAALLANAAAGKLRLRKAKNSQLNAILRLSRAHACGYTDSVLRSDENTVTPAGLMFPVTPLTLAGQVSLPLDHSLDPFSPLLPYNSPHAHIPLPNNCFKNVLLSSATTGVRYKDVEQLSSASATVGDSSGMFEKAETCIHDVSLAPTVIIPHNTVPIAGVLDVAALAGVFVGPTPLPHSQAEVEAEPLSDSEDEHALDAGPPPPTPTEATATLPQPGVLSREWGVLKTVRTSPQQPLAGPSYVHVRQTVLEREARGHEQRVLAEISAHTATVSRFNTLIAPEHSLPLSSPSSSVSVK